MDIKSIGKLEIIFGTAFIIASIVGIIIACVGLSNQKFSNMTPGSEEQSQPNNTTQNDLVVRQTVLLVTVIGVVLWSIGMLMYVTVILVSVLLLAIGIFILLEGLAKFSEEKKPVKKR